MENKSGCFGSKDFDSPYFLKTLRGINAYSREYASGFLKSIPLVAMGRYAFWFAKKNYRPCYRKFKDTLRSKAEGVKEVYYDKVRLDFSDSAAVGRKYALAAAPVAAVGIALYLAGHHGFYDMLFAQASIKAGLVSDLIKDVHCKDCLQQAQGPNPSDYAEHLHKEGYTILENFTVTTYQNVDEKFYSGMKIPAFDEKRHLLGFYRKGFLEQVKIDGSGNGSGGQGNYLCYDYGRSVPGKDVYYFTDFSKGAYGDKLVPWDGENPSVAINPVAPHNTRVRFLDLGPDSSQNEPWVNERLKSKVFNVDDKFSGIPEDAKKVDVYVGHQKRLGFGGPETFIMNNVTIAVKFPEQS